MRAGCRAPRASTDGHVAVEFVDARAHRRAQRASTAASDGPTDVLSFPIDGADAGAALAASGVPRELGDVVICPEHTADVREAIVHGVLHLLGMDHETDDGEMLALQRELLAEQERARDAAAASSRSRAGPTSASRRSSTPSSARRSRSSPTVRRPRGGRSAACTAATTARSCSSTCPACSARATRSPRGWRGGCSRSSRAPTPRCSCSNGEQGVGPRRPLHRADARRGASVPVDDRGQQGRPARRAPRLLARAAAGRRARGRRGGLPDLRAHRRGRARRWSSTSRALMPEGPFMFARERDLRPAARACCWPSSCARRSIRRTFQEVPARGRGDRRGGRAARARTSCGCGRSIWVESESQKGILVGAGGRMIKAIGTAARRELERELGLPRAPRPVGARAPRLARRRGAARPARASTRAGCVAEAAARALAAIRSSACGSSPRLPQERDGDHVEAALRRRRAPGCAGSARARAPRARRAPPRAAARARRRLRSAPAAARSRPSPSSAAMRRSSAALKRRGSSAVDDHRVELAPELLGEALLELERLGDRHLGALRHGQIARCARGRRAARAPCCACVGHRAHARDRPERVAASAACRARDPSRARRARPGHSRRRAAASARCCVSSQTFTMLEQLLRARRGRGEVLEGAARGEDPRRRCARPAPAATRAAPGRGRSRGSTGPPASGVSAPAPARRRARTARQPAAGRRPRRRSCAGPRRAASRPSAAAIVVLPTPPLPVTTSSLRSSSDVIACQSVSNRARAACTYNRAHERTGGDRSTRRSPTTSAASCRASCRTGARGEVLTLAYMNAQALAAHARRPASCTCGAARATSCGTRARRAATRRRCARCGWTATATRCSRSSSRPGPPATRASAPAFTAASSSPAAPHEALPGARAHARASAPRERPAGSYTVELLDDPQLIGEKVMEEAEEVARAAREESDERVDEEAADVLYHLLVLLRSRGRSLADAERVLDGRRS